MATLKEQIVPMTPLPAVGAASSQDHSALSDRFQEHSVIEMAQGNRLQSAEAIWGTVVHQVKAVAERRGWQHKRRVHLHDVVMQVGKEHGDPQSYLDQMA